MPSSKNARKMERQSISRKRNFSSRLPQTGDVPAAQNVVNPTLPQSKKFALSTPPSSSNSSPSTPISFPSSVAPPKSSDHLNDGEVYHNYVINGCGKSVKAIHTPTKTVFVATSYNAIEAQKVIKILYRIEIGQKYYKKENYDEMSDRIWPKEAEFIKVNSNKYVLFVPSIEENVHTLAFDKAEDLTEFDIQNIFFQLANITDFCHQIGIIVRDLKPRRMLLKNIKSKPILYITSITDFTLLDDPEKDLIKDRFISPAFVPPELLDMGPDGYSGKSLRYLGIGCTFIYLLLSKDFTNMVHTLLQKAPEDRPTADEIGQMTLPSSNLPCRSKCQQMLSDMVRKFENMREALDATNSVDLLPELDERRERMLRSPLRVHATRWYGNMKMVVKRNMDEINNITAQKRMQLENRKEWAPLIRRIAAERFALIMTLYKRENREPHPGLSVSNLPLELLLPPEVYPPRPDFRMKNYAITHEIYYLLKRHDSLKFPTILADGEQYNFKVPIKL
ncbi:unnamed protein product [Caenorhabditis angaria]|uniref:Protein kinase domain-containing protein n=1 Tax=Caenorhabditis angaria TaxID=860376 RepID=A0A9P1J113_9PELO|nr:unnamed protein product [Caenorhabditis angaria]